MRTLLAGFKRYKDYFIRFLDSHRRLFVLLVILSLCSLVDIPGSPRFGMSTGAQILYLFLVSIFKAFLLTACLAPLYKWRVGKWIAVATISIFALLAVTNLVSFYYYEMGITRKLIRVFAQTTFHEATGFSKGVLSNLAATLSSIWFYIIVGGIIFIGWGVKYVPKRLYLTLIYLISFSGFVAFAYFAVVFSSGRSAHLLTARIAKYTKEVWQTEQLYKSMLREKKPLPYKETATSTHRAPVVIVVIGESAHKRHHSLYGYHLPTTPGLDSVANELIIFTDAIGSSMGTAGNMERILSLKEDDTTDGDALQYPFVVDLFKAMGYKVFWLSNQERTGTVSNTSGVMTMNADMIKYIGAENSEDALLLKYDEALLPELDNALHDPADNKLIFLHLMGSHTEYKERYPASFNYFKAEDELTKYPSEWLNKNMAQTRAEYDNSIRYTDHILSGVLQEVKRLQEPAIMIYFSDHGEEVYDFRDYIGRNANTVQVPFVIFFNPQYCASNTNIIETLQANKDKPYSTANWEHLLMTLTGGTYKLYNPVLDPASTQFSPRPRYVDEALWTLENK